MSEYNDGNPLLIFSVLSGEEMPYDYRKMSPEERRAIVETRQEHGYPYHAPPHPIRMPGWYLLTAACYEHVPIMSTPERRSDFESRLLSAFKGIQTEIGAWVVLPTHYHILSEVADFSLIQPLLHKLHNGTAYEWNQEDGCVGKRKVWFRFFDRLIRGEAQFYQALNYIHANPVKHGYVKMARDWTWSSVDVYYEKEGREWLRKTWTEFPPEKLNFDRFDE